LLIEDILRQTAAVSPILQAMVLAWRFMSGLLWVKRETLWRQGWWSL
jgi:hypothetical protein